MVTVGPDRTLPLETYLGGEAGLGDGEGERGVRGRKRQAREGAVSRAGCGPQPRTCRLGVSAGFGHREVVPGPWGWKQT